MHEMTLSEIAEVSGGWGYRLDYQNVPTAPDYIIDDPRDRYRTLS